VQVVPTTIDTVAQFHHPPNAIRMPGVERRRETISWLRCHRHPVRCGHRFDGAHGPGPPGYLLASPERAGLRSQAMPQGLGGAGGDRSTWPNTCDVEHPPGALAASGQQRPVRPYNLSGLGRTCLMDQSEDRPTPYAVAPTARAAGPPRRPAAAKHDRVASPRGQTGGDGRDTLPRPPRLGGASVSLPGPAEHTPATPRERCGDP